ncbi:peptidase [Luteimicrobium subarcticum]|uniref:Uncharacterized protein n=1 Tax=Luteimicrobium subarcticum TaxID=620910 RepID=A0A2M8WUV4_9MICO|nr:peptidase [Luteimicrobium subarcticum]PJI94727.1 hypothetical protein CLV34_0573 [Luteimicrobium subarcticum]
MTARRTIALAVSASALVMLPSAAFADDYGAGDFSSTCPLSDTTPVVGQTITCTLHGPANTEVTGTVTSADPAVPSASITVAGAKAVTKTTDASGTAGYSLTFADPGTYTFTLTATSGGAELSTQQVVVSSGDAGVVAGSSQTTLGATGAEVLPYAVGALGLIVVGAGVVMTVRSRRA